MSPGRTQKAERLEAEIVVIGSGGAGLAAAITAGEKGCTGIIVLEKMGSPGGNSAIGGGIFAAESPAQKREGIDARRDDFFKLATRWAHWKVDSRIVRAYIDKSGDTIRWLEEKGFKFPFMILYRDQDKLPRVWHGMRGAEMIKVLRKNCEDLGVQILVNTRAMKLLTGAKGNITGVLAATKDKEYIITTKSVIIATGGYGGNKRLLKKYCRAYNENMYYVGVRHNTGDGLLMATEIGAAVDNPGTLLMDGPVAPRSARITVNVEGMPKMPGGMMGSLSMVAKVFYVIWVNKLGRRFIDETACPIDMESGNAVARQPEGLCFALFDSRIRQLMEEKGLNDSLAMYSERPRRVPGLRKELQTQAKQGTMMIANSWDEIAKWIGANPRVLKAEIDAYNAACDQGHDSIFVKDPKYLMPLRTPPYYAIRCQTLLMDTLGGIKINEKMEVLDQQHNPIPGLYAAGVCCGGVQGDLYDYDLPGSAQGFGLNSGRIAGENAAKYVSE